MANPNLFATNPFQRQSADITNAAGAPAYSHSPRHKLAQLAVTGCFNQTFYADAQAQLDDVLQLAGELDDTYIAQTAIYCRERGLMKDMPALLVALLAARGSTRLPQAFERVIDNGKMLRNFVQFVRSGVTGRRSLGSRPKKLVQSWLNRATERQLLQAAVGSSPSLADLIKMVHPKPAEAWRGAFFAWQIGRPFEIGALPPLTRSLLAYRRGESPELPDVPHLLLGDVSLSAEHWARLASRMGWQALRMNLNTLARHGAFGVPELAETVAARLSDPAEVLRAKVYPYQLLAAFTMTGDDVPALVRHALQDALEVSLANVPKLAGRVAICPDVSGSMHAPVTGYRPGATTSVRCIDVAALVAAAFLRTHPDARVLPFAEHAFDVRLNPRDSVMTNARSLATLGGGGTHCAAPLAKLELENAQVDTLVMVSDNQAWIDKRRYGATATMEQWARIKRRNPSARMVCIDLQPYGSTQALEREDILNVGGFGDAVFDVIAQFAAGSFGSGHWVESIEATRL